MALVQQAAMLAAEWASQPEIQSLGAKHILCVIKGRKLGRSVLTQFVMLQAWQKRLDSICHANNWLNLFVLKFFCVRCAQGQLHADGVGAEVFWPAAKLGVPAAGCASVLFAHHPSFTGSLQRLACNQAYVLSAGKT